MYNYIWRIPLAFTSPCQFPLCSSLYPLLLTWNPPSCDRNRPPRSQVACKLTLLAPPFTQTLPPPNSQTPTAQRLTKTTSGIIRLLLSGTGRAYKKSCRRPVSTTKSQRLADKSDVSADLSTDGVEKGLGSVALIIVLLPATGNLALDGQAPKRGTVCRRELKKGQQLKV